MLLGAALLWAIRVAASVALLLVRLALARLLGGLASG